MDWSHWQISASFHFPGCLSSGWKVHFSFLESQILSETLIAGWPVDSDCWRLLGCYAAGGRNVNTTYCGQRLDSLMSMLRPKLHFLTARACRKELRFQEDLKSWGSHLRNLLPPGLALRHGSADVMKLSDLRDRRRPIRVGKPSERCHLWFVSCRTAQTHLHFYEFYAVAFSFEMIHIYSNNRKIRSNQ